MKIGDCQLFVYKYRTIGDKVKGASFSALKFSNMFKKNVLGFFVLHICTIIVRPGVKSQKIEPKTLKLDHLAKLNSLFSIN